MEVSLPSGRPSLSVTWTSVSAADERNHKSALPGPTITVSLESGAVRNDRDLPLTTGVQFHGGSCAHTPDPFGSDSDGRADGSDTYVSMAPPEVSADFVPSWVSDPFGPRNQRVAVVPGIGHDAYSFMNAGAGNPAGTPAAVPVPPPLSKRTWTGGSAWYAASAAA